MKAMRPPIVAPLAIAAALATGLGAAAPPASAHHGWSGYDSAKEMTLTGTIAEAGYEHPHGFVKLRAGTKVWVVVLAPPTRMENRGLPREALRPGATATVVGYPKRDVPDEMRAERITVAGKTTELR